MPAREWPGGPGQRRTLRRRTLREATEENYLRGPPPTTPTGPREMTLRISGILQSPFESPPRRPEARTRGRVLDGAFETPPARSAGRATGHTPGQSSQGPPPSYRLNLPHADHHMSGSRFQTPPDRVSGGSVPPPYSAPPSYSRSPGSARARAQTSTRSPAFNLTDNHGNVLTPPLGSPLAASVTSTARTYGTVTSNRRGPQSTQPSNTTAPSWTNRSLSDFPSPGASEISYYSSRPLPDLPRAQNPGIYRYPPQPCPNPPLMQTPSTPRVSRRSGYATPGAPRAPRRPRRSADPFSDMPPLATAFTRLRFERRNSRGTEHRQSLHIETASGERLSYHRESHTRHRLPNGTSRGLAYGRGYGPFDGATHGGLFGDDDDIDDFFW